MSAESIKNSAENDSRRSSMEPLEIPRFRQISWRTRACALQPAGEQKTQRPPPNVTISDSFANVDQSSRPREATHVRGLAKKPRDERVEEGSTQLLCGPTPTTLVVVLHDVLAVLWWWYPRRHMYPFDTSEWALKQFALCAEWSCDESVLSFSRSVWLPQII